MLRSSYNFEKKDVELERLILQFCDDWNWEKKALANLGIKPNTPKWMRLLSYGCGSGIDAATLLEEGYAKEVEGWDISADTIEQATRRYGHKPLVFRQADLLNGNPPVNIPRFDVIYLRLVLQHIQSASIVKLLGKCKDLLNDGGYLLIHDTDRVKDHIRPRSHEFNLIANQVRDYFARCGNNTQIGSLAPKILTELNFKNIRTEMVELQAGLAKTISDLSYAANFRDPIQNQKLISKSLWERACANEVENFKRTTFRFITVGQK